MELPIDHFRLLGVNPATDAQAVLHALKQRLDRPPEQGFSPETLQARAELLRSSADLLSSQPRRADYEASITSLAAQDPDAIPALDIPSSRELGGLLLLLEAGQPLDCLELVQRSMQPPRAPALNGGREADLALLAGLSCLAGAADLHQQRRYESAAQILVQGLQLLQSTGQQPQLRDQLQDELDGLQPFRVLDLLSRDLAATAERSEGLALLDALVQRRGGLEGDGDPSLPRAEFQAFFRQIRSFLTVQEQVDLFSRWGNDSGAAHFLATTALTASGFARRKPEQIAMALDRLKASGQEGTLPLQACLQLLLGRVDEGLELFTSGAPPELQQWAQEQSSEPLAQLCAYTSDWLGRDVLPGYRDLEADPDLEAYFADRDVQAYVEQHDTGAPGDPDRSGQPRTSLGWPSWDWGSPATGEPSLGDGQPAGLNRQGDGSDHPGEVPDLRLWLADWLAQRRAQLAGLRSALHQPHGSGGWLTGRKRWVGLAAVVAVLAAGGGTLMLRQRQAAPTPIPVRPATPPPAPKAKPRPKPSPAAASQAAVPAPLTAEKPSETQLKDLLQAWLTGKAAVLAGGESPIPLAEMARAGQVASVLGERQDDAAQKQTQRISTTVRDLVIEDQGPQRIAVIATLDYSDQRLDASGEAVGEGSNLQLRNRYVFARDGERWLLASFQRAR